MPYFPQRPLGHAFLCFRRHAARARAVPRFAGFERNSKRAHRLPGHLWGMPGHERYARRSKLC
jgi:hypothetical protein